MSLVPQSAGAYLLAMNRDESPRRSVAREWVIEEEGGRLRWAYPRDPDGGGTWLGVNGWGFSFALLNQHPPDFRWRGAEAPSRGRLILSLLELKDAGEIEARLGQVAVEQYNPFWLQVFFPGGGEGFSLRWRGKKAALGKWSGGRPRFWASSPSEELNDRRAERFQREAPGTPTDLVRLHHELRLQGSLAQTVSLSLLEVGPERIRAHYELQENAERKLVFDLGRAPVNLKA